VLQSPLIEAGMVFASDSRTNAGVDNISSFRKMYAFRAGRRPGDRDAQLGQPVDHPERHQPARDSAIRQSQASNPPA
jgi:hypothetical protein